MDRKRKRKSFYERQQANQDSTTVDEVPSDGDWQTAHRSKKSKRSKKAPSQDETQNHARIYHSNVAQQAAPLRFDALQQLVLYILNAETAPSFIAISNRAKIRQVVLLNVPGLDRKAFQPRERPVSDQGVTTKSERRSDHAAVNPFTAPNVSNDEAPTAEKSPPTALAAQANGDDEDESHANESSPDFYLPLDLDPDTQSDATEHIANLFLTLWPTRTSGDNRSRQIHSAVRTLLMVPAQKPEQSKHNKPYGPQAPSYAAAWQDQPGPIDDYVASVEQLEANDFPLHPCLLTSPSSSDDPSSDTKVQSKPGWVNANISSVKQREEFIPTSSADHNNGNAVFALDCEMCQTAEDSHALCRVSLIAWDGQLVLDELVQPPAPVTDHKTMFSGVTKEMLDPVTTTLHDVQQRLLSLLGPDSILVGHSLESDLGALKFTHPRIVDTSLLYPHAKGAPLKQSLRFLAQKFLNRIIQNRGASGHDPQEDARAALDLVKLKCARGGAWGTPDAGLESLFARLSHCRTAYLDWSAADNAARPHADTFIKCASDAEVVDGISRLFATSSSSSLEGSDEDTEETETPTSTDTDTASRESDTSDDDDADAKTTFVFARMRELAAVRGWWTHGTHADDEAARAAICTQHLGAAHVANPAKPAAKQADGAAVLTREADAAALARTTAHIAAVYDAVPPATALVVFSGNGDARRADALGAQNAQFRREVREQRAWDAFSVRWTPEEEDRHRAAVSAARNGVALMTVKY